MPKDPDVDVEQTLGPTDRQDTPAAAQSFLSISRDGRVSIKMGTIITVIATALASGGSVGGLTLLDQFTGPSTRVVALEEEAAAQALELVEMKVKNEARDAQLAQTLELTNRTYQLVLRVHKIETTIDGKPVDLDP